MKTIRQIADEIPLTVQENAPRGRNLKVIGSFLKTMPERTAVVALDTELGRGILETAAESGLVLRRDFGIVSIMESPKDRSNHSYLTFDFETITRALDGCAC